MGKEIQQAIYQARRDSIISRLNGESLSASVLRLRSVYKMLWIAEEKQVARNAVARAYATHCWRSFGKPKTAAPHHKTMAQTIFKAFQHAVKLDKAQMKWVKK